MVSKLFQQFIKETKYLGNLSQRTLDSYEKDVYKRWIVNLRSAGLLQ